MKKLLSLIIFSLLISACRQSKQKEKNYKVRETSKSNVKASQKPVHTPPPGIMFDTSYLNGQIKIDTVKYKTDTPKITQLPFGYDFERKNLDNAVIYYKGLEYKNVEEYLHGKRTNHDAMEKTNIYKLPPINKFKYISISFIDTDKCGDGTPLLNYLKITKYRVRLPNINKYKCFYAYDDPVSYSSEVIDKCQWALVNCPVNYFILYDPATKNATVFAINFDTLLDGTVNKRYFYIDKNYKIYLAEISTDAERDPDPPLSKSDIWAKFLISISNNGEIIKNKIK